MASSINGDTLSTLGSSQFDNLSFAERDRLDVELEEFLNIEENSISDEFKRFIKGDKVRITRSPLEWWLEPTQGDTYPNLQKFAIDVFSIPPMSAEPERLFSGGRRTVSWARCRLSARTIEMLECVKHWIKTGLDEPIEGEEDEEIVDPSPEELAQVEADWDELTIENLAEHVRRFAQNEELDADGEVSRAELFAMDSIPLLGAEQDSNAFESDEDEASMGDVDDERDVDDLSDDEA